MAHGHSDIIKFPGFTVDNKGAITNLFTSDKIFGRP